jgi:hypothetical protein
MKALFRTLENVEMDETTLINIEEDYNKLIETSDEVNTLIDKATDLEESLERINALTDVIKEYGLSKSMVAAINAIEPGFSKNNLLPSIEDLNDVPTKDAYSESAVEVVYNAIIGAIIGNILGTLLEKYITAYIAYLTNLDRIVMKYINIFKTNLIVNDDKLSKANIKYFKNEKSMIIIDKIIEEVLSEIKKNYSDLFKLVNDINKVDDTKITDKLTKTANKLSDQMLKIIKNSNVQQIFHYNISLGDRIFKVNSIKKPIKNLNKIPLKQIIPSIKVVRNKLDVLKNIASNVNNIKALADFCRSNAFALDEMIKKADTTKESDRATKKENNMLGKQIKKQFFVLNEFLRRFLSAVTFATKQEIKAVKAFHKCCMK